MSLVANSRYKLTHEPPPFRRAGQRTAQSTTNAPPAPVWAAANAQIVHPSRGRIAFEPYWYQHDFLASYHEPRRIILKARQIGFSQVFALEALYAAITEPEQMILLVSRSQDLAVNLLRYCYLTYNNLREAPALTKANESELGTANGSRIKSIPANRSTGRGFAANRIYLDEFAYAAYADDIYQSVAPAVSQGGYLTIGSTPNGTGNLFHRLYVEAGDFARMRVPWYRCKAYNPAGCDPSIPDATAQAIGEAGAWFASERPKYTAQQWAAEFECDFVGSGVAVFQTADIERATDGAWGERPPERGRDYLTSVDIGRRQDATVINTFDVTAAPYQRVAHDRLERVSYPVIQDAIAARWRAYGGQLWIESNGVGDPVIENLDAPAQPFVTTARSKVQAIQRLQLLLEQGRLKAAWTPQERRELLAYQWDDRDLTQDCVMSLAIGAAQLDHVTPEPVATSYSVRTW